MDIQDWDRELTRALANAGMDYSADLRALLYSSPHPTTQDQVKFRIVDIVNAMQKLFWKNAADGETFGDVARIKSRYGKTVEENYGVSEGPFVQLARTYWTYKIELGDIGPEYSGKWIVQALQAVELKIADLFFPTPGPYSVSAKDRLAAQRKYLEELAPPNFDVVRFLEENPYLSALRDESLGASVSAAEMEAGVRSTLVVGLTLIIALIVAAVGGYLHWSWWVPVTAGFVAAVIRANSVGWLTRNTGVGVFARISIMHIVMATAFWGIGYGLSFLIGTAAQLSGTNATASKGAIQSEPTPLSNFGKQPPGTFPVPPTAPRNVEVDWSGRVLNQSPLQRRQ